MYEGDASRKRTLVEHGFRLPSALDNRPLKWNEFLESGRAEGLSLGDPRQVRDGHHRLRGRAGHPADRSRRPADRGEALEGPDRRPARGDPHPGRQRRTRARDHPDQEDGGGTDRLPRRSRVCECATCTPTSTPCAGSSCSPSFGRASTTCSSASTCSARGSTCRRSRSWRSSTPTRRGSCDRARRSSRRSAAPHETCRAKCTCTRTC